MDLAVTRRNFQRLEAALRHALPTLQRAAEDEDRANVRKAAAGYPTSTVQQGIHDEARAALGME